ncbi:type IV secretory system conjugative DNA transfer family protein [Enterococcus cecorum]|uniref:Type IV secretory system conjugative DNA transfer family protein n=1 Tax=Enterococcus cecorum TaxID=44008 RepID=A0AAW9JLY2_9ENTE|nr:type IV secretory system conjugative DNA transfer family protein [Enterococcus cecorum]MDZ5549923.1 type IV secretory system conjugative DNA transfer family protein [Enterococcus cecorum]MDZ5598183.1 type IV secretory system conjugative DNA transfer family protein [Enterococcus cecorum]
MQKAKEVFEIKKKSNFREKKQYSPIRRYKVDGEGLPIERKPKRAKFIFIVVIMFIVLFLIMNYLFQVIAGGIRLFSTLPDKSEFFNYWQALGGYSPQKTFHFDTISMLFALLSLFINLIGYYKLHFTFGNENVGQKGDDRLTTIKELKKQYPAIPESVTEFEGLGGLPISHYNHQYFIDRTTSHAKIVGPTRSGKDETIGIPMIDIISRAKEKASMLVNDAKGEMYAASYETLRKRGYDVEVLNLLEPLQSMGDNQLELALEAYLEKDYAKAQSLIGTLTWMMYNDPNAKDTFWQKAAAKSVSAMALALIEEAVKHNEIDKVSMYNVTQMLVNIASVNVVDPITGISHNQLDDYFKGLPQTSIAKAQYATVNMSAKNTRSSILATANEGLQIFYSNEAIIKMTSKSSIDLKRIGFPRTLTVNFESKYFNEIIYATFKRGERLIGQESLKINAVGKARVNFKYKLQKGDQIIISREKNVTHTHHMQTFEFERPPIFENNQVKKDEYTGEICYQRNFSLKCISEERIEGLLSVEMAYSERPVAIFMILPDYDTKDHVLASIFVSQLYYVLAENASKTRGQKTHLRVHFILNEFGNMPAIDDMASKMTVSAGRNILWYLFVQSNEQITSKYGNEIGKTIQDNCQNQIFINSNTSDTIEDFSKRAGTYTDISKSKSKKFASVDASQNLNIDNNRLIPYGRASQLLEGENIVIRSAYRRDLKGRKIRPFAIFNHGETEMPYRYTFLAKQFDTSRSWDEFEIPSQHRHLKVEDLAVNLDWFIPKNWRKNENGELELNLGAIVEDEEEQLSINEEQKKMFVEYINQPIFDLSEEQSVRAKSMLSNALSQKSVPNQIINELLEMDMQAALIILSNWLSDFDDPEQTKEIVRYFVNKRDEITQKLTNA